MGELLWLHSGGAFNKEPENDLGNYPSRFEISGEPPEELNTMNNLYDDVMPEEGGMVDYRCFYLWNPNTAAAMQNIQLELTKCQSCRSTIQYGSKLQNDIQEITIKCKNGADADVGGFVIFDMEFGSPFTVYYNGNWCEFGADMQARIREQAWCDSVTVTGCNPFTVTFQGGVGNRNVRLIRVVQNDLTNYGLCRYNTQIYFSCDPWNGYGDTQVLVVQPISDHVPLSGTLRIYNPLTGLWDAYDYWEHDTYKFYLTLPLKFNLVGFLGSCPPVGTVPPNINLYGNPQNWQRWYPSPVYYDSVTGKPQPLPVPWGVVEAPCDKNYCEVCVVKIQYGSPINTIAPPIPTEFTKPDSQFFIKPVTVGNLRPNEGFYWWIQRSIPSFIDCCLRDYFDIKVSGVKVSWPLKTGGG